MTVVLAVALGGGTGAALRYLAGVAVMRLAGPGFPLATLLVNVLGSFAMGLLVVWFARRGHDEVLRHALATGLLGGFTTFSSFSLDVLALWERGEFVPATLYLLLSVALALIGIVAGLALGRHAF